MIEVKDLSFSYNKNRLIYANLNLTVKDSDVVGLLGHNGAGKTTLIKLLAGLLRPNDGEISMNELMPNINKNIRGLLAYMPENDGIYEELTVLENVRFRSKLLRLANANEECERVLKSVGLYKKKDEKTAHLSNGMRKRLMLACSCLGHPQILLLDEPSNGIDQESKSKMIQLLKTMNEAGTTILMSTHDFELVNKICNQVVIIQSGSIAYNGNKPEKEELEKLYADITYERDEEYA